MASFISLARYERERKWQQCEDLISKNINSSLAEGTKKNYKYWMIRMENFCQEVGRSFPHFDSRTVCGFLSRIAEDSTGVGGVDQARSALRNHFLTNFPEEKSPTECPSVTMVIKGIKKRFSKPVAKKKPLASSDFEKLLKAVTQDGKLETIKFCELRFAAQLIVLFCTISRYEETCALKVSSLVLEGTTVSVNFPKGKQYQMGEARSSIIVDQPQLSISLVKVLKFYTKKLKSFKASNDILFPSVRVSGSSTTILQHAASYDCVRNQFKRFAAAVKIEGKPEEYGLHSMRRGAASAAVNNGCDDHVVSKQMRVGVSTVRRYATLNSNSLKKAANAVFS